MDQEQIDQDRESEAASASEASYQAMLDHADAREAIKPRAIVRWFAQQMEHKLRVYDSKPGWWRDGMTPLAQYDAAVDLQKGLDQERWELRQAITAWRAWQRDENGDENDPSFLLAVLDEAGDVANYAMMIADALSRGTVLGVQGLIDGRGKNTDSFPKRRVIYALHPEWMALLQIDQGIVVDLDVEQLVRDDETKWLYRPLSTYYTLGVDAFEREIDAIEYAQQQLTQYDSALFRQQDMLSKRHFSLLSTLTLDERVDKLLG